jgi:hypothetical protein
MNRIAAFVIAAAVAVVAGCGTSSAPLTSVAVYWEFDRNTFVDGVESFVVYDSFVNWPPNTGSRACPQSGVDVVDVTDLNGNLLASSVPCVNQSVQGVVVSGFPGNNTYVVTGWRFGRTLPLYRGQVTIPVVSGVPTFGTVFAAGIPDELTVDAILADANAPLGYPTCGLAGIQQFTAAIEDGFGTLVWRNPVPCRPVDVPGVSFGFVDRDVLSLWIDAWDTRPIVPQIVWSICQFDFPHFPGTASRFSLQLPQGVCSPPPP